MAGIWWFERNYSHRGIVCIPTASTTADYITWTPEVFHDEFWTVVQDDAFDVRAFDVNGDPEGIERKTWDYASRSGSFSIGYTDRFGATDYSEFRWVYWGYAAATDGSGALAETVQAADTTHARIVPPYGRSIVCRPADPGATTPLTRIAKTSAESIHVWWNVTPLLGEAAETTNGRMAAALILLGVDWDATAGTGVYSGGTRQAAMTTQADTSAFEDANGDLWVGVRVLGGTVDTDYTMSLRLWVEPLNRSGSAGSSYMIETLALLQVRNPDEA